MIYNGQSYPEEEVEIDVKEHRDQRKLHHVTAVIKHNEYGSVKVAYGFPKSGNWHEKIDGREKFMYKLKDIALDKLLPEDQEVKDEKDSMNNKVLEESEKI